MFGATELHAPNPMQLERMGDPNDWTEQQVRDAKSDLDKGKGSANQKINNQKIQKAAQLKANNDVSKQSESEVKGVIENELKEGEILLVKPRIYFGDDKKGGFAVPDFAVFNTGTGTIVKIYDAKNGGGEATPPQIKLHNEGGRFYGTSRSVEQVKQREIGKETTPVGSGLFEIIKTDIKLKN
jgi:hypothetical protein